MIEGMAAPAAVFAALGDVTRLGLIRQLSAAKVQSISALARDANMTRQAVTKHLKVLHDVGLVQPERAGREQLYALQPQALGAAEAYLRSVSAAWDDALARLQAHLGG